MSRSYRLLLILTLFLPAIAMAGTVDTVLTPSPSMHKNIKAVVIRPEDFFYNANLRMHQLLMERNIPHEYMARPGGHSWGYWATSVQYELLFFHEYFAAGEK